MNVLVTGGNGFVGSSLCKALFREGINVIAGVRSTNPSETPNHYHQIVMGDMESWKDETLFPLLENIDIVVHTASRVHRMNAEHNDEELYKRCNVEATTELAQAAAKKGVKRFIFLSTIKVNGEASLPVFSENDIPAPSDSYAKSKLLAEKSLMELATESNLQVTIFRLPLIYGQGVKGNLARLITSVEKGILFPFGSVDNQRSLLSLANLADVILRSIDVENTPNLANQVYLLADHHPVSIQILIRKIADNLGKNARLIPVAPTILKSVFFMLGKKALIDRLLGDLVMDTSKIQTDLDWVPAYDLDNGLKFLSKKEES